MCEVVLCLQDLVVCVDVGVVWVVMYGGVVDDGDGVDGEVVGEVVEYVGV